MFDGSSRVQGRSPAAASQSTRSLTTDLRHVIFALSDALDLVGIDDLAHGKRVGIMAAECAKAQGADAGRVAQLFDLGLLHDVGVSSTTTHGHLVAEFDWESSQVHCEVGYALLRNFAPLAWMALADQVPPYALGKTADATPADTGRPRGEPGVPGGPG
jgi:response regulator RpfG family c-di-GMP phosphodiesterase